MDITINDKHISIATNSMLNEVLENQAISPKGIATAVNGIVIPSSERATTELHDGDKIVIIKAFYGG